MGNDRSVIEPARRARRSAWAAVIALLLWPLSYAWVPFAGRNPGVVLALVPIAELTSLILAVSAVVLAGRARRGGARGRDVSVGMGLGLLVIGLIIGGNVIGLMLQS